MQGYVVYITYTKVYGVYHIYKEVWCIPHIQECVVYTTYTRGYGVYDIYRCISHIQGFVVCTTYTEGMVYTTYTGGMVYTTYTRGYRVYHIYRGMVYTTYTRGYRVYHIYKRCSMYHTYMVWCIPHRQLHFLLHLLHSNILNNIIYTDQVGSFYRQMHMFTF